MFYFNVDDNIQLRILEAQHAEELFELTDKDRNYLREWLPWVDRTKSVEDTKNFIQSTLHAFSDNNGFTAAIFYKGKIAGCIGLHAIDWDNRKTTIGYWLGSEYQGHGIMTKSCSTLVDYLFNVLELNRVEIRAAEFNSKSKAIPERLGFTQEGIIRDAEWLYVHYVDNIVYGMLRGEWKSRG